MFNRFLFLRDAITAFLKELSLGNGFSRSKDPNNQILVTLHYFLDCFVRLEGQT